MSHILLQMDDYRTALDARDARLARVNDSSCAGEAEDWRERTAAEAERGPSAPKPRFRRLAVIVPIKDYRGVSG